MKQIVRFETPIACSVEALFDFHADTNNLPLITPPGITVDILKLVTPLKQGNEVELSVKKGLLRFYWKLVFEKVVPPYMIVDTALKSPFQYFRHQRRFIPQTKNSAILEDEITFELPFDPFSRPFIWLLKQDFKKMFAYRHQETKRLLERS